MSIQSGWRSGCPQMGCPGGPGCGSAGASSSATGRDRRDKLGKPVALDEVPGNSTIAVAASRAAICCARGRSDRHRRRADHGVDSDGAQAIPLCRPISCRPILFRDHAGDRADTGALDAGESASGLMTPGAGGRPAGLGPCGSASRPAGLYTFAAPPPILAGQDGARARWSRSKTVALHDPFDRARAGGQRPDWDGTHRGAVRMSRSRRSPRTTWPDRLASDWRRNHRHRHRRPRCPGPRDPAHGGQYFTPRVTALRVTLDEVA